MLQSFFGLRIQPTVSWIMNDSSVRIRRNLFTTGQPQGFRTRVIGVSRISVASLNRDGLILIWLLAVYESDVVRLSGMPCFNFFVRNYDYRTA